MDMERKPEELLSEVVTGDILGINNTNPIAPKYVTPKTMMLHSGLKTQSDLHTLTNKILENPENYDEINDAPVYQPKIVEHASDIELQRLLIYIERLYENVRNEIEKRIIGRGTVTETEVCQEAEMYHYQ